MERHESGLRWIVLFLGCLGLFGSYYCYDIPSSLKDQIQDQLSLDETEFNLLYTSYSLPNIVLAFFGGYLVDRFGVNRTILSFLSFIVVGQALFAIAADAKSYSLAIFARVVFGIGGECLTVAQSTILCQWFKGRELAMAMALNLSVARLGSVVNDFVSPEYYNAHSLSSLLWFGFGLCVTSLLAMVLLLVIERWAKRQRPLLTSYGLGIVLNEEPDFKPPIHLNDFKTFSKSFWCLLVSCVCIYASVLPFNNIGGGFLQDKYGFDVDTADRYLAIPFLISALTSPFLGGVVDRIGWRAVFITMCAFVMMVAHLVLGLAPYTHTGAGHAAFALNQPFLCLFFLGIGYSIYGAAIWPTVAFLVEEHQLGTAYGVLTAVQNLALSVVPLLAGVIKDNTHTYKYVQIMFAMLCLLAGCVGVVLNIIDYRRGSLLNKPYQGPYNAALDAYEDDYEYDYPPVYSDLDYETLRELAGEYSGVDSGGPSYAMQVRNSVTASNVGGGHVNNNKNNNNHNHNHNHNHNNTYSVHNNHSNTHNDYNNNESAGGSRFGQHGYASPNDNQYHPPSDIYNTRSDAGSPEIQYM